MCIKFHNILDFMKNEQVYLKKNQMKFLQMENLFIKI